MTGRKIAGIVVILVAIVGGLLDVLLYMHPHPRRWIFVLILCGLILILGIILVAVSRGKTTQAPVQ